MARFSIQRERPLNFLVFIFLVLLGLMLRTVESSKASTDNSLFGVLRIVKHDSQIE